MKPILPLHIVNVSIENTPPGLHQKTIEDISFDELCRILPPGKYHLTTPITKTEEDEIIIGNQNLYTF